MRVRSLRKGSISSFQSTTSHTSELSNPELVRKLTAFSLASLIFFEVSGGAYGIEGIVKSGGPLYAIIGLILVPLVWSTPIALMTAELSTNYPVTGGQVVWANRAFGPFWGFQCGYWSFIGNIFDTAVLPVMCIDYLSIMTGDLDGWQRWIAGFSFLVVMTLVNIRGIDLVGNASIVFSIIVILPFIIFFGLGIKYLSIDRLLLHEDWTINDFQPFQYDSRIASFLTVLLWNSSGYDMAGACAGEVSQPGRYYPRALAWAVTVTSLVYVFPVIVGVCVPGATDYEQWDDGYFTTISQLLGGKYFGYCMAIVGTVSSLGMLNSMLMSSAREIYCMADMGIMPSILGKVHKTYHTPYVSILVVSAVVSPCILIDFDSLVQYSTFIDSAAFVLEFAAFIVLRVRRIKYRNQHAIFSIEEDAVGEEEERLLSSALINNNDTSSSSAIGRLESERENSHTRNVAVTHSNSGSSYEGSDNNNFDNNYQYNDNLDNTHGNIYNSHQCTHRNRNYTNDNEQEDNSSGPNSSRDNNNSNNHHQHDTHSHDAYNIHFKKDLTEHEIYEVPGGILGVVLVSIPPLLLCLLTFIVCNWLTWVLIVPVMGLGVVIYFLYQRLSSNSITSRLNLLRD